MQVSKQKVNQILKKQVTDLWCQMVADIKSPEEARTIFEDLFSETEMEALVKRLAVGYWLTKKRSYEVIKQNLKVSSATIATVASGLIRPGWKMALQKILAEEWATKWEAKIMKLIKPRAL